MMGKLTRMVKKMHAHFSPSSAEMAVNCSASKTKTRGMPDTSSQAAIEGTAVHHLSEIRKRGMKMPKYLIVEGQHILITDEMIEASDTYLAFLDLLHKDSDIFEIEQAIDLDWFFAPEPPPEPVYGTSDCIAYNAMTKTLTVADFKYGVKWVDVNGNPQLMIYALGAIGLLGGHEMPEVIRLVIIQPRAGGQVVRHHTMRLKELLDWAQDILVPALKRIAANDQTENAGAWCRYCKRAGECAALRTTAIEAAQYEFNDTPIEADTLSNDKLGEILTKAEMIEAWVKTVRATVSRRIDNGQDVPGWKLVQKRAIRKWSDPAQAELSLAVMGDEIYTTPELKSPAQIEKILKKHGLDAETLDDLVTRESSGTTLVREADAREKVTRISASALFDDV
jgi:hypothetical protein